jgi:16S rRNA (adenine1518-N6/adenine1519-N6)-dimethyltransferase
MGVLLPLVKSNESRAKKRFGQHFLRDTGVLERIIRWIQPAQDDFFLDIGAGDGALSLRLAERAAGLAAIEIDRDCIPPLERALAPIDSATIIQGDILNLNLLELIARYAKPGQKIRIAGNLPYNIATTIITKLLHSGLPIEDLFFMVQLEVAQRITASPVTRQYGSLSVDCQHHADVQLGFKISPACFVPRPKVSSAMISLRPKAHLQDSAFESVFESLTKAAFAYRRKTLENSLRRHPMLAEISQNLLDRAGIDGSRRAEDLTVREYEDMANILHAALLPKPVPSTAALSYTSPLNSGE